MKNEILAKRVCFNLTRVILSRIESGIGVEFWPADDPGQLRDVIPLRCGGCTMSELDLLRDVVRALVAQRRAFAFMSETMKRRMGTGERLPQETADKARRASVTYHEQGAALDRALARLAEVNPRLFDG